MTRRIVSLFFATLLGTALFAAPNCNDAWNAHWITKAQSNSGVNSWIGFRTRVNLEAVPATLPARIAADTKYWLWINGEQVVFEGGLKRGPFPSGTYYDVVDIAPYLHEGENLIAVLLWHLGKNGFSHLDSGTAALIFDAEAPGTSILSDRTWESSVIHSYMTASTPELNYRLPESSVRFDARRYPYEWFKGAEPKFMGSAIELPFKPGDAPFGELVERPVPLWKDYGLKHYESVRVSGDTLICKLPYNGHFSPWLKTKPTKGGDVIRMETDHAVVTGTECVRAEYVTREGVQEYEHLCWMNGEVMYYILEHPEDIEEVMYRETGYDTAFSGYFRCDDELLNEYWQKAVRTMYVCMRDTYYDCPDRERAQWWGDEVNELSEAFFMFSPSAGRLARKGIYELIGWQKPDGSLYAPVPAGNWIGELPMQTLASVGWYGFYRQGFYSGDFGFVPDIYDRLHRYLHETWQTGEDNLPIYRKGDWNWPDAGDNCDEKALLHPWYYLALKAEREFALQLGRMEDAAQDEAMMAGIAKAFNDIYWNGKEYRSKDYTELTDDRVNAMAVVSGLADPSKYPAILKVLQEQRHATTYMHRYVLEALCIMGHPELAQELMHLRYPTIMDPGCSTLWEHWDFDGSCNHAWAGCGTISMFSDFAGIVPVEPGFRKFAVRPQMGGLKHIEAGMEISSGMIELTLDRKGKRTRMTLTVPEGTTAEILHADDRIETLGPGVHRLNL